jgi:hypothetical protein
VTGRVVAVALIVIGLAATAAGLWGRFVLTDDEGHHDGREPGFALGDTAGADQLIVEPAPGGAAARVERAGQTLVEYDELHDGRFHTWAVGRELDSFVHSVAGETAPDGVYAVGPLAAGDHRVVIQAAPSGGPDLLELGADVTVDDGTAADQVIATGDTWTDGELTVERQGFDFVLSEPWTGEEWLGAPAFLSLFRADDLAFTHAHATTVGDDRFRFAVELPGAGSYLAAVELVQDGELVTALFRFEI